MNELQDNAFHVPALFVFLCCFAASSFLLATYFWLWRTGRVAVEENLPSLSHYIRIFQIYSFLSVAILSIVLGVYGYISAGEPVAVYAESFVLVAAIGWVLYRGGLLSLLGSARRVFVFFIAVCGFWLISMAGGWGLGAGLNALYSSFATPEDLGVVAVLFVGIAWIVPNFVLYRRLSKEQRRGMKFHNVLMPVLLAFMMLLLPLFIEQAAQSEKFQKMMHPVRPIARV